MYNKSFEIVLSFDDGMEEDIKVIELLDKYNLKGLFYIPVESWGFNNSYYAKHDIAGHSFNHPQDLKKLDDKELEFETISAFGVLRSASPQNTVSKFCPPRGRYDKRVIKLCKDFGIKELRTTNVFCIKKAKGEPAIQDTTIHFSYPKRKEYPEGSDIVDLTKEWFQKAKAEGDYFHLWGHGFELAKYGLFDKFEEILKYIHEHK